MEITKTVTIAKWTKQKELLLAINTNLKQNNLSKQEYKILERIRGYFCHLAIVSEIIFPFLKGFDLTLSSHPLRRDEESWKLTNLEWSGHFEDKVEICLYLQKEADNIINMMTFSIVTTPGTLVALLLRFH